MLEIAEEEIPAERIYKKNPDGSQSEVSGAISFFLMGKLKPERQNRLTTGNLHYAPVTETAWIPVFEVKRKEDITVEAMSGHKIKVEGQTPDCDNEKRRQKICLVQRY